MTLALHELIVGYDTPLTEPMTETFRPGDRIRVAGPNGSGKSTLLRVIAGRQAPLEGRVESQPDERFVLIGDRPALYDYLSLAEHLRFFARLEGMPPPDPDHWLERYGLGGLDRRLGVELSLGQSKRFGLLLGEVLRPSVLLLDEPYVGLDDSAHALVPQLTDVVSERDGIVFMASHVGPDGLAGWRSLHLDRREPVCEQA